MKATELDKASGKYEEDWKPEVGQECDVDHINQYEYVKCFIHGEKRHNDAKDACYVYEVLEGDETGIIDYAMTDQFRPIQTPSDRYREEQLESFIAILLELDSLCYQDGRRLALRLFDEGCRIIAPDEYVVKALTDEQKYALLIKPTTYEMLIDAVQNAMLGGER